MKFLFKFVFFASIVLSFVNCNGQINRHQESGQSLYDALYKDSFEVYLNRIGENLTYVDTLYTEMFIALRVMSPKDDGQCARMVIEKVDILVTLDTITNNKIHYLEAKQLAQGALKDIKGFLDTAYRIYNLYPENSIERLSSLGAYFLSINKNDSAVYYLNRCLQVSEKGLNTLDVEEKEKCIIGVLHSLVLLGEDENAKLFVNEQIEDSPSGEIKELLYSISENYQEFKHSLWEPVRGIEKLY